SSYIELRLVTPMHHWFFKGSKHMTRKLRTPTLVALTLLLGISASAQTPRELFRDWQHERLTRQDPALVKHADLQKYLAELRSRGVSIKEVGHSLAGRPIHQMEFGRGPLKVFMWSQMHGDEPTATSALLDLFAYLRKNRGKSWVKAIEEKITLRAVPMLNPDGAELYQRRNLQFIDINRDARNLVTPEGRLLKQLRDDWRPDIGFNLHNQNTRTSVGDTGRQATISLLAVPSDASGSDTPGRIRNKKLCAVMVEALSPFIYGHIGRYDDSFNPRAFGDLISQWGTPVILIETGALKGMSSQDLVGLNFVAYALALKALSDGSVEEANPAVYDALRMNEGGIIYDLILRGATLVKRTRDGNSGDGELHSTPYTADVAVNVEAGRGDESKPLRASVQDVGDLSIFHGLDEVDARGYFVVSAQGEVRPGSGAALLFYSKEQAARVEWEAADLETRFPPEAIYRNGQWERRGSLEIK
ncbi:MAG TPA: M14 family zinc carboxypeptidase, partial [Pyrinomonadaceae bacterium]|nr:M14 family zinc carboxypeptidase [Pyrinomonadaceae bacterium]